MLTVSITRMHQEGYPNEKDAPSNGGKCVVHGRVIRIVHVANAAHWRRPKYGADTQWGTYKPSEVYQSLKNIDCKNSNIEK